jgi:integrase
VLVSARQPKQDPDLPPGIFRRGDRYRVIVYVGADPVTGRQRRVTGTARTKREAVRLRARLLVEVGRGRHQAARMTVAELLRRYLEHLEAAGASPSTIDRARIAIQTTINPRLGQVEVAKLRPSALDAFYSDLRGHGGKCQVCWARLRRDLPALRDGERYDAFRRPGQTHRGDCVVGRPLKPSTIRRTHGVLSAALALARRWDLVDRNPARDASPPKVQRPEIRPPGSDDVGRLLDAAAEQDFEWFCWLRLDAMTGARRGELCAVRLSKLDWRSGELRMDRAIIHAKGPDGHDRLLEVPTKAATVKRPVLDPSTLTLVRELVRRKKEAALRCGVRLPRDALLFSADVAGREPVRPQLMTKRFARLRDRLGLRVRLHDMRHWVATSMLSAGVPVQTAAGRLGNDPQTLLRVYSHFLPGSDKAAGDLLAGLVDGPWLPDDDGDPDEGASTGG